MFAGRVVACLLLSPINAQGLCATPSSLQKLRFTPLLALTQPPSMPTISTKHLPLSIVITILLTKFHLHFRLMQQIPSLESHKNPRATKFTPSLHSKHLNLKFNISSTPSTPSHPHLYTHYTLHFSVVITCTLHNVTSHTTACYYTFVPASYLV